MANSVHDSSVVVLLTFLSHLSPLLPFLLSLKTFLALRLHCHTHKLTSARSHNSGSALQPVVRRDGNDGSLRLDSGAPGQVRKRQVIFRTPKFQRMTTPKYNRVQGGSGVAPGFAVNGNGGYPLHHHHQHDQQHLYRGGGGQPPTNLTSSSANSTPRRYEPASILANNRHVR